MSGVTWIDAALLDALVDSARGLPRRRLNRNLHRSDDSVAHRLLNAIEPGSYVQPHCHLDADKDETIIALRGRLGIVVFAADGSVADTAIIAAGGDRIGIDIAHGVYHSLVALDPGCIIFEAKAGPYRPLVAAEKAAWAPAEGDPGAAEYQAWLRALFE